MLRTRGAINARCGTSNIFLLTLLGGGAFGHAPEWLHGAIKHAAKKVQGFDLDVRSVSYGPPSVKLQELAKELA